MAYTLPGLARRLGTTVLPVVAVLALTATALAALDAVPARLRGPMTQEFGSIEEAQAQLGVRLIVPAYFPDYLSWPPSSVEASRRPFLAVSLSFTDRASSSETLWVIQVLSADPRARDLVPMPAQVLQIKAFPVKYRQGTLVVGTSEQGQPTYQVRWDEEGRFIAVTTTHSLEELVRIAGSMVQ